MHHSELIDTYLKKLRDNVVIDCGHVPVSNCSKLCLENFDGNPQDTILKTLEIGLQLWKKLKEINKKPILSICLSDTSRFVESKDERGKIKELIENNSPFNYLPESFCLLLNDFQIKESDLVISLQSVNSNSYTNLIKKIKKKLKSKGNEEVYNEFGSIFLTDKQSFTFLFTNDFLLNHKEISDKLGGDWWKDDHIDITSYDCSICPDIRVKKLGVVKLYDKNKGILCPATYGGLLCNYDESYDHISIYSRADDPYIAEKIIRGIVSKEALRPSASKSYLQLIHNPELNDYEISFYKSEEFTAKSKFCSLYNYFKDTKIGTMYDLYI